MDGGCSNDVLLFSPDTDSWPPFMYWAACSPIGSWCGFFSGPDCSNRNAPPPPRIRAPRALDFGQFGSITRIIDPVEYKGVGSESHTMEHHSTSVHAAGAAMRDRVARTAASTGKL